MEDNVVMRWMVSFTLQLCFTTEVAKLFHKHFLIFGTMILVPVPKHNNCQILPVTICLYFKINSYQHLLLESGL
jgi:hypothetical protein